MIMLAKAGVGKCRLLISSGFAGFSDTSLSLKHLSFLGLRCSRLFLLSLNLNLHKPLILPLALPIHILFYTDTAVHVSSHPLCSTSFLTCFSIRYYTPAC